MCHSTGSHLCRSPGLALLDGSAESLRRFAHTLFAGERHGGARHLPLTNTILKAACTRVRVKVCVVVVVVVARVAAVATHSLFHSRFLANLMLQCGARRFQPQCLSLARSADAGHGRWAYVTLRDARVLDARAFFIVTSRLLAPRTHPPGVFPQSGKESGSGGGGLWYGGRKFTYSATWDGATHGNAYHVHFRRASPAPRQADAATLKDALSADKDQWWFGVFLLPVY